VSETPRPTQPDPYPHPTTAGQRYICCAFNQPVRRINLASTGPQLTRWLVGYLRLEGIFCLPLCPKNNNNMYIPPFTWPIRNKIPCRSLRRIFGVKLGKQLMAWLLAPLRVRQGQGA
jgi:hypothetical protein